MSWKEAIICPNNVFEKNEWGYEEQGFLPLTEEFKSWGKVRKKSENKSCFCTSKFIEGLKQLSDDVLSSQINKHSIRDRVR